MQNYIVTYRTGTTRDKFYTARDCATEAEARSACVMATACDHSGPAGIQSVAPEATEARQAFDKPSTKAMRALIKAHGPDGTGRIVGLSIEGLPPFQTVFIYTESAAWCDDSGSGTFAGGSESAAIARYKARVMPANGCRSNPQPLGTDGPCTCRDCMAGGSIRFSMTTADTWATVYMGRAEDSRAGYTVTAPRMTGPQSGPEAGLYVMADTDGQTVAAWRFRPQPQHVAAAIEGLALAADIEPIDATTARDYADSLAADIADIESRIAAQPHRWNRASYIKRAARYRVRAAALRAHAAAIDPAPTLESMVADSEAMADHAQSIGAGRNTEAPQRPSRARAKAAARAAACGMAAHVLPASAASGAFPLWAVNAAPAIDESLDLFSDYGGPFESVRYGVGLPEARETIATRQPGGRWIATRNAGGLS